MSCQPFTCKLHPQVPMAQELTNHVVLTQWHLNSIYIQVSKMYICSTCLSERLQLCANGIFWKILKDWMWLSGVGISANTSEAEVLLHHLLVFVKLLQILTMLNAACQQESKLMSLLRFQNLFYHQNRCVHLFDNTSMSLNFLSIHSWYMVHGCKFQCFKSSNLHALKGNRGPLGLLTVNGITKDTHLNRGIVWSKLLWKL